MRRVELARLNHVLIPATKTGRDRYRRGLAGLVARPVLKLFRALSDEGRVMIVFWLVCGAAGVQVDVNQIHLLWCALTGVFVASLVIRGAYRLSETTVTADHPARVTVGDDMTVTLHLHNAGPRDHAALRIDRPLLPWDGQYVTPPAGLDRLSAEASSDVQVGLRFIERGEHHLDPFHVAKVVPLGLCVGPSLPTRGLRFLVVPRPARVAALDVPTGHSYQPGGVALASHTGEARELAGLRPYRPGDPVRDLCARAWARTGAPVVREYQQEYFTRFGVVLDTDPTAGPPEAQEAAIQLAAGVLAHLGRTDALVDLLVVGDDLHRLTLGRNLGFIEQALDVLAVVRPGGPEGFDGDRLSSLLAEHLQRLSAVVFVSLGRDPARLAFAERIRAQGVGCRTLVVDERPGSTRLDPHTVTVSRDAIAREEALRL